MSQVSGKKVASRGHVASEEVGENVQTSSRLGQRCDSVPKPGCLSPVKRSSTGSFLTHCVAGDDVCVDFCHTGPAGDNQSSLRGTAGSWGQSRGRK